MDARVEHIRNFTAILSVLKLSRKQHVHVTVSERGVTFVAVDASKSLQAQANFRAEVFREYRVNAVNAAIGPIGGGHHRHTQAAAGVLTGVSGASRGAASSAVAGSFGLALGSLIDVLNVFSARGPRRAASAASLARLRSSIPPQTRHEMNERRASVLHLEPARVVCGSNPRARRWTARRSSR